MSVAAAISGAVAAAVTALALPGVAVERRKTPSVPKGQTLPQAVVSVGEEGDFEYLTARKCMVTYPVAVTLVTPAGGSKLADDATLRGWRESIRKKIEAAATFAGVPQFNMVQAGGREPFDRAALAKDLNYSSLLFTVTAIEDTR